MLLLLISLLYSAFRRASNTVPFNSCHLHLAEFCGFLNSFARSCSIVMKMAVGVANATVVPSITVTEAFKASLFGSAVFFIGLTIAVVFLILAKFLDDLIFGSDGWAVKVMGSTEILNNDIFSSNQERPTHAARKKTQSVAPSKKTFQIGAMKF